MVTEVKNKLKERFTDTEIESMRKPQREPLRFIVEGEDAKPKINVYRIKPEEGIAYCNMTCGDVFETYKGILKLRVMSRVSNTEWKEIAYIQRDKDGFFDEMLLGESYK